MRRVDTLSMMTQLPPVLLRELNTYLACAFRNRPLQYAGKGVSPQEASRPLRVISDGISLRCIIRGSIYQGSTSLEEIVTKEMFQLAMRWFWDRNGGQTSKHTGEIAWSIRCYATKHLTADEETLAFYASAMKRLRDLTGRPLRQKPTRYGAV